MTTGSGAVRGDVLLLVGTRKGEFILSSDISWRKWSLVGPYSAGSEVFHFVYDPREGGRTIAAVNQMVWGPEIQITEDLGSTRLSGKGQPRFSEDTGRTVDQLWHVEPGRKSELDVLYAVV